ncbi:MAG: SET domain-containing protein-lysine N-methyltransferase [Candidatus Peregrinibacteria bacterium]
MLLVHTTIGISPIEGIGVFAAERIKKGTPVWEFTKGFDLEIPAESIRKLPSPIRETIRKYAYRIPGTDTYILPADDARFMNHSDHPSVRVSQDDSPDVAARDIELHEELTADYSTFDEDFTGFPSSK